MTDRIERALGPKAGAESERPPYELAGERYPVSSYKPPLQPEWEKYELDRLAVGFSSLFVAVHTGTGRRVILC